MTNPARPASPAERSSVDQSLLARALPSKATDALLQGRDVDALRRHASVAWVRGRDGSQQLGFGDAIRLQGPRSSGLDEAIPELLAARQAVAAGPGARVRFFGGARFRPGGRVRFQAWDTFGGWQFVLPRLLLDFSGPDATATVVASAAEFAGRPIEQLATDALNESPAAEVPPAGESPGTDIEHWAGSVATAVDQIVAGCYRKVVLAVHRQVDALVPIDTGRLLSALADRYPDCYTFKFTVGGASWLGASPELLVANDGGTVRAASLAGSRPRGKTVEADDDLAHGLVTDTKEQLEHRLVVEALKASLAAVCTAIEAPVEPQIMRMANIQHLYTPVQAALDPGRDILDLVRAVHPTPAVGGEPRAQALDAIESLEAIDRGWYAAPVGWFDLHGNGEFAVGLRSGLVRGRHADLFAGCGIVEGSIPAAEVAEVEQKLRALGDTIEGLQA